MKKVLAFLALTAAILTLSVTAFADGTTTLTTEVPEATYTMTIPEDCTVDFNATSVDIGNIDVVATEGFTTGKNVKVTITKTDFTCENAETTIPFSLSVKNQLDKDVSADGSTSSAYADKYTEYCYFIYFGQSDKSLLAKCTTLFICSSEHIQIGLSTEDWGKALAGTYTATLTFTSEVVASES